MKSLIDIQTLKMIFVYLLEGRYKTILITIVEESLILIFGPI